jgi:hypothetical protein
VTTSAGRRANVALLAITLIWAASRTVMKVALT